MGNNVGMRTTYQLKQAAYPNEAANVTDFIKTDEKQERILAADGVDRRRQYNQLPMCIRSGYEEVDISKYIVQLTMQFDQKYYVGTGTIIGIFQNKLILLTCAHNVVTYPDATIARNVWFSFDNRQVSATKFHIFPKYDKNKNIPTDLAIIECELNFLFSFYHVFPALIALRPGYYDASINGYPGEKKGEFWGMKGKINCNQQGLCMYKDIDTTGGQSGSPIIVQGQIVAVHTNGGSQNYGNALTMEKIQWINDLMNPKYFDPAREMIVTIRSKYHGKYWCATVGNDDQCKCNAKNIGPWEIFWSFPKGKNKIALKSHHPKWVQIKQDCNGEGIHAHGNAVKTWELFELHAVDKKKNQYAIKCDNGKFISSKQCVLNASVENSKRGETEIFVITPLF
eukprot:471289_1